MKIITWNCNMAFRRKADLILQYHPDILVVPECEKPGKLKFPEHIQKPTNTLWFGKNIHKGLGIFSYNGYKLKLKRNHNPDLRTIVPISIKGVLDFELYAIWANNPADPDGQYVTQVWKAIHHYKRMLSKKRTILIGDFNSNKIWDRPRREGNHSTVVSHLEKRGIHSTYHRYFRQEQGEEQHPTFYLYKNKNKPYHLDYCFASEDLAKNITSVEVGDYDSWKQLSDHVPVIVNFNDHEIKGQ